MNTPAPLTEDVAIEAALHGRIAAGLTPLAAHHPRLRERLAARAAASVARHQGVTTRRLADARWQEVAKGVRAWVLHDNGLSRSAILQFDAGARVPSHRHSSHEECLMLSGSLQADHCLIGKHDYHLAPAGSRHPVLMSEEGGTAFLRGTSVGNKGDMLREYFAAWLPGTGGATITVTTNSGEWHEITTGVFVKTLWREGDEASILLRIKQGACAPAMPIALGKECLMLEGEAFIGDMLLREGEFQFTPAGSSALETFSDTGALCYVHGQASALLPV